MTELLNRMITDYKNKGNRVDEVLFQEVMKVIEQAQELETIKAGQMVVIGGLRNKNKRLREALESFERGLSKKTKD